MKQDKKYQYLSKRSSKIEKKLYSLNHEIWSTEGYSSEIDSTYWYWGPVMSSEQFIRYIKTKKGEYK